MTDLSARATIRKEIQERLSGIAAALEGSMGGDTNVDVYTPSQVIQLIVNAIKWAPPKPEMPAEPFVVPKYYACPLCYSHHAEGVECHTLNRGVDASGK